jgi:hypothetical protein
MIYRLYRLITSNLFGVEYENANGITVTFSIYEISAEQQTFKKEVLAGAELQDADGNVMTQEQADAFIKELP